MVLWHPYSPGGVLTVDVYWPRYLFNPEFATYGELIRSRKADKPRLEAIALVFDAKGRRVPQPPAFVHQLQ